jgi:hypothetical protein
MWKARTKDELIIEVWEFLDCESVGAEEIIKIEEVVIEKFGEFAVDSPMTTARKLADEGAELRHPEIMSLHVKRFMESTKAAQERGVGSFDSLRGALFAIRNLENMRRRHRQMDDKNGLRHSRQIALDAKRAALQAAANMNAPLSKRLENREIASWLTVWLQTPDAFDDWVKLRIQAPEFRERFGTFGEDE